MEMKIPSTWLEDAENWLKRYITNEGKRVMKTQKVTLSEGKAIVVKRITVQAAGAGGAGATTTVGLYALAHGNGHDGTQYTRYYGDDGNYYTEHHDTGDIFRG